MKRTVSVLLLLLLSSPAASQTRGRPMGEFRADGKGVSVIATFEARSTGELALDVSERIDEPSLSLSLHCTVAADAVAGWADSTTTLINEQMSRPQSPEEIEFKGPELPSDDCAIRVERTIYASGSKYSLAIVSRALTAQSSAVTPVTQAQALAFVGKVRGTATVTLAMSHVVPGSPTNPSAGAEAFPVPTNPDHPYFEFQVEKPVAPMSGNAAPPYPALLRAANVEGEVLAQFVVDTNGRAEMNTFKVLKSSHDLFTTSVELSLPQMRFHPAEIAGKKVRQLVQMPFVFSLNKRSSAPRDTTMLGGADEAPKMLNRELPFHYPFSLFAQRVDANVTLRRTGEKERPRASRHDRPSGVLQISGSSAAG